MDGPFIFIGTHRIRDGKREEFTADARALAKVVEAREPQLHAFHFFLNDDETEATVVQVHPNAESMLMHMGVAEQQITKGTEEQLETQSIQIYGPPNETVLGMIEQLSQAGVPITVKPLHLAGFTRTAAP
jgi:hypothetical protein